MPTVSPERLIYDAFRALGVLRPGQGGSSEAMDDALRSLNDMIDSWNTESLMIPAIGTDAWPLTGAVSYTIGPTGMFVTPVPPQRITHAGYRYPGQSCVTSLELLSAAEYRAGRCGLYYQRDLPNGTIYLPHAPSPGAELVLDTWRTLNGFQYLTETVRVPAGYAPALRWNLAVELMPQALIIQKIPNALLANVQERAIASKAAVKSFNSSPPPVMDGTAGPGCGGHYDICSDTFHG